MQTQQRSVLVGLVFALGGVLVAGVSVGIVLARRRGAAAERLASEVPGGQTGPDDQIAVGDTSSVDGSSQLPADMRPEDPSHGPVV